MAERLLEQKVTMRTAAGGVTGRASYANECVHESSAGAGWDSQSATS